MMPWTRAPTQEHVMNENRQPGQPEWTSGSRCTCVFRNLELVRGTSKYRILRWVPTLHERTG